MAFLKCRYGGIWYLIDKTFRPPRWVRLGRISAREAKIVLDRYNVDQTYLKLDLQHDSKVTLVELTQEYIDWAKAYKADYTIKLESHALKKLCQTFGKFQITDITPRMIEDHFRLKNYKPYTVHFKARTLIAAYKLAVAKKYIRKNTMKGIRLPRIEELPPRYLDPKIVEKLFRHMSDRILAYYKILYYTGMRPGEAIRLHTRDVDLEKGRFLVAKTKTKRFRLIPIHRKLLPHIRPLLNGNYLFAQGDGYQKSMKMGLRRAIERAKLQGKGITAYAFRHTFATQILDKTSNLRATQVLLGHARSTMTERYAYALDSSLKEAVESL